MSGSHNRKQDMSTEYVSVDKRAEILQATFKHYFDMAMDHHTKAGTTSNMLLIIIGAVIGLVGFDNKVGGVVDFVGGLTVTVIGVFGVLWARKQHERYHYWSHIAYRYQKELSGIMPELQTAETGSSYALAARDHAAKLFRPFIAVKLKERYLLVWLHITIILIGIVLSVLSVMQA